MKTESIHIGLREEIIEYIKGLPNNYRAAGQLTLESQLDKLVEHPVTKSQFGAVFMLCDNESGGINIDKFWVNILNPAIEAKFREAAQILAMSNHEPH